MKKFLHILIVIAVSLSSCSKKNQTPDGPTDIRIRNTTSSDFVNVVVKTEDESHNYGDVNSYSESEYIRFEKAYPDSEITLSIGGIEYTTGVPDNTYAVLLGQGKFTYDVWVAIEAQRKLDSDVIPDAPLDK